VAASQNPQEESGIKITKKIIAIFVSPMIVYRLNWHIFMSQGHATKCVDNRVCDFENKKNRMTKMVLSNLIKNGNVRWSLEVFNGCLPRHFTDVLNHM